MFKFLRELGGSIVPAAAQPAIKDINTETRDSNNMVKKNKQNFKIKRKDVVQELESMTTKYPYARPIFLGLRTQEELRITLDHADRLITLPKRSSLPRSAGYAELVNFSLCFLYCVYCRPKCCPNSLVPCN